MSWWIQVYLNEFKKVAVYKALFWFDFVISTFSHVLIAYFLWEAIFTSKGVTEMNGYTLKGIVFYYLISTLVEKLNHGAGWRAGASMDIYEGGLTKFLVYPLSYLNYKSATHASFFCVNWLKSLVGVGAFIFLFGVPSDVPLSWTALGLGFVLTVLSAYMQLVLGLMIDGVAFWADNVWSLQVMLRFVSQLLGGALIPLVLFPDSWRVVAEKLPFVCLFANPVQTLMGKMPVEQSLWACLVAIVWIGIFLAALRIVWSRGYKEYSGVGV